MAQLQFLREWKLLDRRLYEDFERRLLIWGNPKERNREQIKKYAFFLRHPVERRSNFENLERLWVISTDVEKTPRYYIQKYG